MSEQSVDRYDSIKDAVFAPEHKLLETEHFLVAADDHPLTEGHILIIPKENISCVGEFPDTLQPEFKKLYEDATRFVKTAYGSVSTFEHGRIGQTIYHAHVHVLPFSGSLDDIVPEGEGRMRKVDDISEVRSAYAKDGQYLYVSVGDEKRLVDTSLGYPRFFRDRFAAAMGNAELGNWKQSVLDPDRARKNADIIQSLEHRWKQRMHP